MIAIRQHLFLPLSIALFALISFNGIAVRAEQPVCDNDTADVPENCAAGSYCPCSCGFPLYNATINGAEPNADECSTITVAEGFTVQSDQQLSGNPYCQVVNGYNYQVKYCANGRSFKVKATGLLTFYTTFTHYKISVNNGTPFTGTKLEEPERVDTNLYVKAGDQISVSFGNSSNYESIGWRKENGSVKHLTDIFNKWRTNISENGYEEIAAQQWGDQNTGSIYDTYDFNDIGVVFAVRDPAPACSDSDVTLTVSPSGSSRIYLGGSVTFGITTPSSYYSPISNSFTPLALNLGSCSPNQGVPTTCTIINRGAAMPFITKATWTHTFQNCSGSYCNAKICEATVNFEIEPYPSFLTTVMGTNYTKGSVSQPFMRYATPKAFFASPVHGSSTGTHNPLANMYSKVNFYDYEDENNRADFFSWYTGRVVNDPQVNYSEYSGTPFQLGQGILDQKALANDGSKVDVIYVNGSIEVGGGEANAVFCKRPTIIIATENIAFNRNFLLSPDNDKTKAACLFIAGGTVSFNPNLPAGDQYELFVIANNLNDKLDYRPIKIKGGVALQGDNQTTGFFRNINAGILNLTGVNKNAPSEVITYEGARYIDLLGSVMKEPFRMSIRELQYTSLSE